MATAKHGRKGRLLLDLASTPGSAAPAVVPMMVKWSISRERDKVDTTSCDSENKEAVTGLGDWTLSCDGNTDADSDLLFEACDGEERLMYHYPDRTAGAGKLRYEYGMVTGSINDSGGATEKLAWQATFTAAGPITRAFI